MKILTTPFLLFLFFASSLSAQLNLDWQEMGPDNFGGFATGLIIDNRDSTHQTLYVGTQGGGVWKSVNGGDWWTALDCMENMNVQCITQAVNGTIYIGTGLNMFGLQGSSFVVGQKGNGIYQLDANDHFIHIISTSSGGSLASPWIGVNRIAVNPQNTNQFLAATDKGLYYSSDAGTNWNEILVNGVTSGQVSSDVKWSADGLKIFAVVGGNNKLIRSTNGGSNWERISNTTNPGFPTTQGRIEVAIAPSNSDVCYISVATSIGCTYGVFKSVDGGATWDTLIMHSNIFDPFSLVCQGWYDNAIAVMPNDEDRIIVGGVYLYTFSSAIGLHKQNQFIADYLEPTNFVDQFQYVINDANPDEMYVVSDEGIFKSYNASSDFSAFDVYWKSAGMKACPFYSVAAAKDGRVMGDNSDIGTLINTPGSLHFQKSYRGLGFCEFSHLDTSVLFAEHYFGQLKRKMNGGNSFSSCFDNNIDPQGSGEPSRCGGQMNANAPYITPYILHETRVAGNTIDSVTYTATSNLLSGDTITATSNVNTIPFKYTLPINLNSGQSIKIPDPIKSRIFFASNCGGWVKLHALSDDTLMSDWFRFTSIGYGIPYSFAATSDGNTVYTGFSKGAITRTTGFNTTIFNSWNVKDSLQQYMDTVSLSRPIEGIAVDAHNDNHVVCAIAGYDSTKPNFYKSTDGGQTWTGIQVGPPETPAYTCVIDINNSDHYLVGTENGIWTSSDAGLTWQRESAELCDVPVYRLRQISLYAEDCPVLYAATQSKGIWRSFTLTPSGCNIHSGFGNIYSSASTGLIKLYPNPNNSDRLHVEFSDDLMGGELVLQDILGREILHFPIDKTKSQINIDRLSRGMYVVVASKGRLISTSKLIVE